jgi:hypothetical protein
VRLDFSGRIGFVQTAFGTAAEQKRQNTLENRLKLVHMGRSIERPTNNGQLRES